jgi:signal transduction histidine kinase
VRGRRVGRWLTLGAVSIGAVAIGIEWLGGQSVGLAAADFVAGLAFLACGLVVWERKRTASIALLFVATGLAWFLGTLAGSDIGALSTIGSSLLYAHRGPYVHLLLSYPTGRVRSRLDRFVVVLAYLDGFVVSLAQNDALTIALVVAVVASAGIGLRDPTVDRRARAIATAAALVTGVPLVLGSAGSVAGTRVFSGTTLLVAYEATLLIAAVGLTAGLLTGRLGPARVTDLVVELASVRGSGTVRETLARAVGDPSLEIGYWVDGAYVDGRGRPLKLPESAERAVTLVERDGEPVAALVHDPALANDPLLAEAVAAATRLTAANARLLVELNAQLRELVASRRRIVVAGDAQRSRLERRLDRASALHLAMMRDALAQAQQAAPPGAATALAVVEREIDEAIVELHELARGIHPHTLIDSGLAAGLADLAATAPIQVSLTAPDGRFASSVEAAAYFVCAEALANVAKYAGSAQATVDVSQDGRRLLVRITDEGAGGADSRRGSGLRGLEDRVEAVGGRLAVSSPAGRGTTVLAEIPLEAAS